MDNHSWEIIMALAAALQAMTVGVIRYLLNQLEIAHQNINEMNKVNADLVKQIPGLLSKVTE